MSHKNSHERDFEAFLAGEESELARLYRRLPQAEPDAKLDAAVLAMARSAVEPQRVAALRHVPLQKRRPAWLLSLGSAAGVVLAAGIAWQMQGNYNQSASDALQPSPTARAERDVVPITAIVREEAPAAPPLPQPATAPAAPAEPAPPPPLAAAAKAKDASVHKRAESPLAKTDAAPMTEVVAQSVDKQTQAGRDGVTEYTLPGGAVGRAARPAPAPATTAPAAASTAAAPAPAKAEEPLDQITVTGSRIRRVDNETASPVVVLKPEAVARKPANAAEPSPFPAESADDLNSVERKAALATGARRDERLEQEEAGAVADAAKEDRSRSNAAAPAATTGVSVGAGPTSANRSATLQRNARLAPEAWVRAIQALLRDGQRAEALENLELFRHKYPAYRLPAELRELR